MCTSPLASLVQLVLAIDVIVKIKICLQLSPQIVYNCNPGGLYFYFLSLFANYHWEMFAKNHQELFPNCRQELFTKQRITRTCFQTVTITRSCLQTTAVKCLQRITGNCFQTVNSCWQSYFYRLYLEKCPPVLLLQLETGCNFCCEALQFLIGFRKKRSVCGNVVGSYGDRDFLESPQYAGNQR